jgi:peptidoglycan hydrolase-like protein with peptidoglycan-binding domain
MRTVSLVSLAFLLLISLGASAHAQTLSGAVTSSLSLGSSGPQVVALQRILNLNADTQIASSGQGSPGNETPYFGSLTRAAVIRFQQKYASQILTPAGLSQANGFVGSYTRSILNAVSVLAVSKTGANSPLTTPSPTAPPPVVSTSTTTSQNANQKNLDAYIAAVNTLGAKQGMSPDTLAILDADVRQEAATSSDLLQQFYNQERAMYAKQSLTTNVMISPISILVQDISAFAEQTFVPQKAYAASWLGFGGYITYIIPCTCAPAVESIFVALPYPNIVVTNLLLNYVLGSEGFNWHNIPEPGIAALGLYSPGAAPVCYIGVEPWCVPLPSEGLILPVTGSSPVP